MINIRRVVPAVVVAVMAGSVAAAAATANGFHARKVTLNDASIWTAQANSTDPANPGSFVGRANTGAGVIDAAVVATPRPQLLQDGPHVIFHDAASGTVTSIDTVLGQSAQPLVVPGLAPPPGTVAAGSTVTEDGSMPAVDLNAAGEVGLGSDTVGIIDQTTGKVYVFPADRLPAGALSDQKAVATVARGSRLAVGVDGTVHVVSPGGTVEDFSVTGARLGESSLGVDLSKVSTPGSPFTVTAVGSRAVVLDGMGGVYAEGHRGALGQVDGSDGGAETSPGGLAIAAGPKLQQPGARHPSVLVDTSAAMFAINLSTGATTTVTTAGVGAPAAPVYVAARGCAYGAWSGRPAVPADASSGGSPAIGPVAAVVCDDGRSAHVPGEQNPIWRVNRGLALLNDEQTGNNLFFDGRTPLTINDWTQAQRLTKGDRDQQVSGSTVTPQKQTPAESGPDHPPKANDDNLATRPATPLIAHVLANDTDADGDVLAVTGLSDLPTGGASASIVDGGNAVQVVPGPTDAPVTFAYTIDDGRGETSTAHVSVAIHQLSQNAAPVLPGNTSAVSVDAGARITLDLLRDAVDPDGDALTLVSAKLPAGAGSVEFTGAGLAVISPSKSGQSTVSFAVSDGHGGVSQGMQPLTVAPAGSTIAPKTHDDHLQVTLGVPGTVDVLANDVAGSGAALSLTHVEQPSGLTVTQLEGGSLSVTATAVGTTLVHYTATDGTSEATGTLRVDSIQPNSTAQRVVAVRDDATLRDGSPTVIPVLANDIDRAGSVLVIDGLGSLPPGITVNQVDHAALSVSTEQALTTPESFTYTASDGTASATGTVVLRPAPGGVDQPPVTNPVTANVRAGNAIPIDVLAKDFDPEGEALTLDSVTPLTAGQGQLFAETGQLRFVAPDQPLGSVTGTYVVRDSVGNASTGTVTLHVLPAAAVNHPPQPRAVTARVYAGKSVTVVIPLLGIDPDGDVTTLVSVSPPAIGGALLGTLGSPLGVDRFVFTAGTTGGTQVLDYQVRDSGGLLATGEAHIGVVAPPAQNSPPVALPDLVTLAPGALRRVNVLANDSDPDGDPLTLTPSALTRPSGGSAVVEGNLVDVTAPTGVPDGTKLSFAYGIDDGRGGTGTSTVTETVSTHAPSRPPIAVDDLLAPQRAGRPVTVNVLANDTVFNGTPAQATVTAARGPSVASVGQTLRFVMPDRPTTFAYTVTDVAGQQASAVVTVPVISSAGPGQGQPPVAAPDAATTAVGKAVTIDVLANDRDPQDLPLTVVKLQSQTGGTAVASGPGRVTFTPVKGFSGLGGFAYVVSDGRLSSVGTVSVKVGQTATDHPPSQPPIVTGLRLSVPAGGSTGVDLANAVTDTLTGATLSFSGLSGGAAGFHATLGGSRFTVSADPDARGRQAAFTYTVKDGSPKGVAHGSVSVTATAGTRPPPQALPDTASTLQGTAVVVPVLANDVDPLGKGLRLVSVAGGGADGTAVVSGNAVTVTPAANFRGVISLSYLVADLSGDPSRQATGAIRVTIIGRPDAPGNPAGSADSHQVQLSWAVPSGNGGTVSGYTVSWGGGNQQCPLNSCVVTGLANGHDYQFTVVAKDEAGESPPSGASLPIHVDKIPDVPQAPTGVAGDQKVSLTWPVPDSDGSPISSYEVLSSPGGAKQTVTQPSAVFTGLTNGTAYTFTVEAFNVAGHSDFSAASAPQTPAGLPTNPAPPSATTTPNQQTAVATWSAPDNNGSPITSYSLEVFENGALRETIQEKDTSNLTDTVAATYGDTYAFAVSATNAVGSTMFSSKSNTVKATGRPDQVASVAAASGHDSSVPLTWAAPANGGSTITSYEVQVTPGGEIPFAMAGGTVTNLTNGAGYTFTVSACNSNGCGPASPVSPAATPYTVPDPPSGSGASAGSTEIDWTWAPRGDGGSQVTGYQYQVDGGAEVDTSATSFAEKDFACGTTHSLQVRAVNAAGTSKKSDSLSATTADCSASGSVTITAKDGQVDATLSGFPVGSATLSCYSQSSTAPNPASDTLVSTGSITTTESNESIADVCDPPAGNAYITLKHRGYARVTSNTVLIVLAAPSPSPSPSQTPSPTPSPTS